MGIITISIDDETEKNLGKKYQIKREQWEIL